MSSETLARVKATAEGAKKFAEARIKMYQDDGATVPPVFQQLLDVSSAVVALEDAPAAGAQPDEKTKKDLVHGASRALRDASSVLLGVADHLDVAMSALGVPVAATSAHPPLIVTAPAAAVRPRDPIMLKHGLVLECVEPPLRRVIFSEKLHGEFVAQAVAPDGCSVGPETGAKQGQYFTDSWHETTCVSVQPLAHWSTRSSQVATPVAEPTAATHVATATTGAQCTIPGTGVGDGPVKIKFADWAPSPEQVIDLEAKLKKAIHLDAGMPTVEINVPSLVAKFKVERAGAEHAKPELPFFTWAARALKGK